MPSRRGAMSPVRWGEGASGVDGGCGLGVLALLGVQRLRVLTLAPGLRAGSAPRCLLAEPWGSWACLRRGGPRVGEKPAAWRVAAQTSCILATSPGQGSPALPGPPSSWSPLPLSLPHPSPAALIATSCKEKPQTPAPPAMNPRLLLLQARRPHGPPSALLLFGLVLGAAARLTCVGDAYPKDGRCCQDCPPGEWPGHRAGEGCLWGPGTGGWGPREGTRAGTGVGERGTSRWGPGTRGSWASGLGLTEWVIGGQAQGHGPPGLRRGCRAALSLACPPLQAMGWRGAAAEARTPSATLVCLASTTRLRTMSPANPVPCAIRVSVTLTGSQTPRASPLRPTQALPGGPHSRRDKPQTTVGPAAPRGGPPRSPSLLPGRGR